MTRLLVPEMFGVMAIAGTVMMGLAMFSDLELKPSIIHSKRGDDPVFLNTAWVTQIFRGALLWFFAILVSLLIYCANHLSLVPKDTVYSDSILPFVIAILALTGIVAGFEINKIARSQPQHLASARRTD